MNSIEEVGQMSIGDRLIGDVVCFGSDWPTWSIILGGINGRI